MTTGAERLRERPMLRKGFTFVELIFSLALAGLLIAFAYTTVRVVFNRFFSIYAHEISLNLFLSSLYSVNSLCTPTSASTSTLEFSCPGGCTYTYTYSDGVLKGGGCIFPSIRLKAFHSVKFSKDGNLYVVEVDGDRYYLSGI